MEIRGSFLLYLRGPVENVKEVTFMLDGESMGTVTAAPFEVKFNTGEFSSNEHSLGAAVTKVDGTQVTTGELRYRFLSAEEESGKLGGILIPLFGGIAAVMAIGFLVQWVAAGKRKGIRYEPGAERDYGWLGGAVCPKCQRPTPMHLMGFNVGLGKYNRCENCGKWSVMRRASPQALREAELRELAESQTTIGETQTPQQTEEQRLDDSRYLDS